MLNDPVSGLIRIGSETAWEIINHPYFQRLRRIRQLGFTSIVFPGANHTRFEHALGAYKLMNDAVQSLRSRGVQISDEESEALQLAILLHDIGHGPFSHALENSIVPNITHEELSLIFMDSLNRQLKGRLDLAIRIFRNEYPRKFFHRLISSQMDIDRLDYLQRDSFYTGVAEGNIGSGRIVSILNVKDDELVIDHKGIYSVESFLISRRLMYWQVYLHKTVISAEQLLLKILKRAKFLADLGIELYSGTAFSFFLYSDIKSSDYNKSNILDNFAGLDDFDIFSAIKIWTEHSDKIMSNLCRRLVSRNLFKIEIADKPFINERIQQLMNEFRLKYPFSEEETAYFIFSDSVQNYFYDPEGTKINILLKDGSIVDISNNLSGFNLALPTDPVERFFLCYPKNLSF